MSAVNTQSTEGDWKLSSAMTNGKSQMENGKSLFLYFHCRKQKREAHDALSGAPLFLASHSNFRT
jgi:hypothetical protein